MTSQHTQSTKVRQDLLFIGFEPFDEKMYPHTREVLRALSRKFRICYAHADDRGESLFQDGLCLSQLRTLNPLQAFCNTQGLINNSLGRFRNYRRVKALARQHFDIVIFIDHAAYDLTCKLMSADIPLVLWSHDILAQDHPWFEDSHFVRELIRRNRQCRQRLAGVVVQDHNRRRLLDETIGLADVPVHYLPVCLPDDEHAQQQSQHRESIRSIDSVHLAQIGSISHYRNTDQLLSYLTEIPRKVRLTLRGRINPRIRRLASSAKLDAKLLDMDATIDEMRTFLQTVDIGVVGFAQDTSNTRNVVNASGQLVEFLRIGIPVIVLGALELGAWVQCNNCGEMVETSKQFSAAMEKITSQYGIYSVAARKVFTRSYDLLQHEASLIDFVSRLAQPIECAT